MPHKRRSSPRTTRRMGGSTGHTSCSNVNRPRSFAPWSRYSKSLNQVVSKSLTRPDSRIPVGLADHPPFLPITDGVIPRYSHCPALPLASTRAPLGCPHGGASLLLNVSVF